MTVTPVANLPQDEVQRTVTVLMHLLDWKGHFNTAEAIKALRAAKLDVAIYAPGDGPARVRADVLAKFPRCAATPQFGMRLPSASASAASVTQRDARSDQGRTSHARMVQ